jgi:SNF2 family DNA or RNA helicase
VSILPGDIPPITSWTGSSVTPPAVVGSHVVSAIERPELRSPFEHAIGASAAVTSLRFDGRPASAISLPIMPPKLKVLSYTFGATGAWRNQLPKTPATPESSGLSPATPCSELSEPPAEAKPRTRIQPPGAVVKLADRLFYVLQPSLEAMIGDSALQFPAHPFPYQFEGIAFLYPRYAAVLADEMGLGKTMQAITSVRLLLHAGEVERVLLVCPKPLVTNWQREFAHWAPELPVTAIEGDQARRRWQWQQTDMPVKIANYEALARDREVISDLGLEFDLVVLDEAQRIKNRSSATSQSVRGLSRKRSWALTGTPVENSPQDLVGIFEFLAPGYLKDEMKPRKMGRAVADYVLRRTKDKVLTDLPPKLFRDAEIELSPAQRISYELAEKEGVVQLTQMGNAATIQHVFELVLRLKQICNFDPATGDSAKFERLAADLDEVAASGRKALVFSQWVDSLETMAGKLKHLHPLLYHGGVAPRHRDEILDHFKHDKKHSVLLLSYGAGGVGLNLQFSEYVFLYDRWWNPAVEDQAVNRAHRIGAAGQVTVTRFIATGTIEQRIDQILREKREIFDTIFSDVEPTGKSGLTQSEIFGLFKLRCPSGPIEVAA